VVKNQDMFATVQSKTTVTMMTSSKVRGILSPTSWVLIFWNLMFILVLGYELVVMPLQVFNLNHGSGFLFVMQWSTVIFWSVDLVLTFFVGFFDEDGFLVLSRKKIAMHYFKTWLVPDVVVVTIDWLMIISGTSTIQVVGILRMGKLFRYIRVLRILRILRLRKLREAVKSIDEFVNSQYFTVVKSIVLNMLGIMLISHFIGCLWYLIGTQSIPGYGTWVLADGYDKRNWLYNYLTALHWSLTQFTPGSMSVQPHNIPERTYAIIVLVFGMIIFSSIVSSITAATNSLKQMNARYQRQIWQLRKFLKDENISAAVASRVTRYSDTVIQPKQNKVSLKDVELISMLPRSLYMDLMLNIYDDYLQEHALFRALIERSRTLMQKVCCKAMTKVDLSIGDELFGPGETANFMYFIARGKFLYTLEYLEKNIEVEPSRWCCEAVLWTPWIHRGRMKALIDSELIALNCHDFLEIVKSYRQHLSLPQMYGKAFVKQMNDIAGRSCSGDLEDDVGLSDLLQMEEETATKLLEGSAQDDENNDNNDTTPQNAMEQD